MEEHVKTVYEELFVRYPDLISIKENVAEVYDVLCRCYENAGQVLTCGNGGSAADAEHMVAELMKGFLLPRKLGEEDIRRFGKEIGGKLQYGLPAIALVSQSALISAIINDNGPEMSFAQQVLVMGKADDILVGFSTSGNSTNVINAFKVAKVIGMKTVLFTGIGGGILKSLADYMIPIPEESVYKIQDYHLPVYHVLCAMLEEHFFGIPKID